MTVTVKLQLAVLPAASVAVAVTKVVPTGNVLPDAGTLTTVTPGQLSETVGAAYVTTAPQVPGVLLTVILAGQVIVGGCTSFTVTVNEQLAVLPYASVAWYVLVVVPTGKKLPLGRPAVNTGTILPGV